MMYGYGLGHGFGLFGGFFMIVFWALLIWLIIAFLRGAVGHHGGGCCGMGGHSHNHDGKGSDDALEILRKRYANGDITKEEFEEKSQVLKK